MGMFDNVVCKAALPATEELESLNIAWDKEIFQTKSLDSSLDTYTITELGELVVTVVENEYVLYTEAEIANIKPKPWNVYKEVIEKNRYDKRVDYHGVITFYTSFEYTEKEDMWVEFAAYFIYGKLDKIELVKSDPLKLNSFTTRKNESFEL